MTKRLLPVVLLLGATLAMTGCSNANTQSLFAKNETQQIQMQSNANLNAENTMNRMLDVAKDGDFYQDLQGAKDGDAQAIIRKYPNQVKNLDLLFAKDENYASVYKALQALGKESKVDATDSTVALAVITTPLFGWVNTMPHKVKILADLKKTDDGKYLTEDKQGTFGFVDKNGAFLTFGVPDQYLDFTADGTQFSFYRYAQNAAKGESPTVQTPTWDNSTREYYLFYTIYTGYKDISSAGKDDSITNADLVKKLENTKSAKVDEHKRGITWETKKQGGKEYLSATIQGGQTYLYDPLSSE